MRNFLAVAAFLAITAGSTAVAHADTVNTFYLNAATAHGYISGIIDIDVTTGQGVFGEFTLYLPPPNPGSGPLRFTVNSYFRADILQLNPTGNPMYDDFIDTALFGGEGNNRFVIEVPGSLVGYTGGPLCNEIPGRCYGGGEGSSFSVGVSGSPYSGYVEDPSFNFGPANLVLIGTTTTPEPEGLVLAGSGVLAIAGLARRRFTKLNDEWGVA